MDTEEAVKIIYANRPSENYTMLKEALEYLIKKNKFLCNEVVEIAYNLGDSVPETSWKEGIVGGAKAAAEEIKRLRSLLQAESAVAAQVEPLLERNAHLASALIDERANYLDTLDRNPGCSAWTLDECSPEEQNKLRQDAANTLLLEEPLVYVELEEVRKQVEILKNSLIEQVAKYIVLNSECHYRIPIKGSMLTKCDKGVFCDWTTCPIKDEKRQEACEELKEEVCGVDWDEYK